MFQNLEMFRMAHGMAVHAGTRHTLIAENIANAGVAGYRAKDLAPFPEIYRPPDRSGRLNITRDNHIGRVNASLGSDDLSAHIFESNRGEPVSLEDQMLRSVESKRRHDRAVAIYRFGMNVLRSSIGR